MSAKPRSLATSADRRADVDAAAVGAFATRGFFGTTTAEVAAAAGISQAYLYKLYADKTAVFVAALDHCSDQLAHMLVESLRVNAAAGIDAVAADMGRRVAADRSMTLLLLHAACAATQPGIDEAVRRCYAKQFEVLTSSGVFSDADARRYFADSTLDATMHVIGARGTTAAWARALAP